jgi:hypothetical protein
MEEAQGDQRRSNGSNIREATITVDKRLRELLIGRNTLLTPYNIHDIPIS